MKHCIVILLLIPALLCSQPPVHTFAGSSANAFSAAKAVNSNSSVSSGTWSVGDIIFTNGFYSSGDGGSTKYVVKSDSTYTVDSVAVIPVNNGNYAVIQDLPVRFKAYGIKFDVDSFNIDVSGNVVTCSTCSFVDADTNKTIFAADWFWMGTTIEADANYQSSVANYAALPGSPTTNHIYKVLDASDDTQRTDLTGIQYYTYQNGWVWLKREVDMGFDVVSVTSPTTLTVSYTRPSAITGKAAIMGTNNKDRFYKMYEWSGTNQVSLHIDKGDFFIYDDNTTIHSFTSSTNLEWTGEGRGVSVMQYRYTSDTAGQVTNVNLPDNNFLGGIVGYAAASSGTNNISLSDFSVYTNPDNGFRGVDSRERVAFAFGNGTDKGQIKFDNVYHKGASSFLYSSTAGEVRVNNCEINGNQESEVGMQMFGLTTFFLTNSTIRNIGTPRTYTTFSLNNRGRGLYIHSDRNYEIRNNRFINIFGINQVFEGGQVDLVDTLNMYNYITGNTFVWDKPGANSVTAFYTGRISDHTLIEGNIINNKGTSGTLAFGFLLSGGATIKNNKFQRVLAFHNGSNVGTNNVFRSRQKVIASGNKYINSSIDFYSLSNANASFDYKLTNEFFFRDTIPGAGQVMRVLNSGSTGTNTLDIDFNDCDFRLYLDSPPNGSPMIFDESGSYGTITFNDCDFDVTDSDGGNHAFLLKQARSNFTFEFIDCTSPNDTVHFDLELANANITGQGNDFEYITYTGDVADDHSMSFRKALSPDTLTAAADLVSLDHNYNEFVVTGTTQIQNFLFSGTVDTYLDDFISGEFIINAAGNNVTLTTGGNFDLSSNLTIPDGGRCILEFNTAIDKFRVKGVTLGK